MVTKGQQARTSFSFSLSPAYSAPASFAACATFNFRSPRAIWFFAIQSVKYSCQVLGASFGGRSSERRSTASLAPGVDGRPSSDTPEVIDEERPEGA